MLNLQNTPEGFRAGNTENFVEGWLKITHDPWIMEAVQGVHIPLEALPDQTRPPFPYRLNPLEFSAVGVGRKESDREDFT